MRALVIKMAIKHLVDDRTIVPRAEARGVMKNNRQAYIAYRRAHEGAYRLVAKSLLPYERIGASLLFAWHVVAAPIGASPRLARPYVYAAGTRDTLVTSPRRNRECQRAVFPSKLKSFAAIPPSGDRTRAGVTYTLRDT